MSRFSVRKPLTIFVAVIVVILLGIVSYTKMTPEMLPSMDMPYVMVITSDPGATPEEVEKEVTKPMEKTLATLSNIKNIVSQSKANYSVVYLEFEQDVNMDSISVDILQNINLIEENWDDNVGTPTILKLNPEMIPNTVASVDSGKMSVGELSYYVNEELMPQLEGIEGVASISTGGILDENINVVLNQDKIDKINNKILAEVNGDLADAESKLTDGENEIQKSKSQLESSRKKIDSKETKTYDDLSKAGAALDAGIAASSAIKVQISILEGTKASLEAQLKAAQDGSLGPVDPATIAELQKKLAETEGQIKALNTDSKTADQNVQKLQKQYEDVQKGTYKAISGFADAKAQIAAGESALNSAESNLKDSRKQFEESRDDALTNANLDEALTMDTIADILKAQNFSMPAGYIDEGDSSYLVSVGDEVKSLSEVKKLSLMDTKTDSVGTLRLKDVADVFMANNSEDIYASVNGNPGVLLTFSRQSNFATAAVSDNISKKFAEIEKENKDKDISFTIMSDQGQYIEMVIDAILKSLLLGAVFAIIVLFLFLRNIKPTIITIVSIPVSLMFAITLMYFSGVSINLISLSGLAISVGMLVDNSVVVIENIFRYRRQGVSATKAAVAGAKQVGGAVTASTLTTISVFVPIIFVNGITRDLFQDIAITVAFALFASLIVSLTLVPAMSSKMLVSVKGKNTYEENAFIRGYRKVVEWVLHHRAITLIIAVLLLAGSVTGTVAKGFIFMPDMATPQLTISMEMPKGADTEETKKMADKVVKKVRAVEGVETVGAMLDSGDMSMGPMMSGSSADVKSVMMYALMSEDNKRTNDEIADDINKSCENLNCTVDVQSTSSMTDYMTGMSGNISVKVFCDDTEKLQKTAVEMGDIIKDIKGIDEVETGVEESKPEIHFVVNKSEAIKEGLTTAQVYSEIMSSLSGEKDAMKIKEGDSDYDVVVKNGNQDMTVKEIKNLKIKVKDRDGNEKTIKIGDIAKVREMKSLNTIERDNQKRYLNVTATVKEGYNITKVSDIVEKKVSRFDSGNVTLQFSGETEDIMDAMKQLVLMMVLGILFVYLIMVAQFQSLRSPFIIMFTIPLAFTGGLLGLLITNKVISVVSMMGFVMLCGIIVNNGIVLVDYINQLRAAGYSKKEAIIQAGVTRMRPVFMTSLTTILGLLVMALGMSMGTDMMQPVAIVCIGGLIYATLMTLLIIPVMYDLFNREKYKIVREEDLDITGLV